MGSSFDMPVVVSIFRNSPYFTRLLVESRDANYYLEPSPSFWRNATKSMGLQPQRSAQGLPERDLLSELLLEPELLSPVDARTAAAGRFRSRTAAAVFVNTLCSICRCIRLRLYSARRSCPGGRGYLALVPDLPDLVPFPMSRTKAAQSYTVLQKKKPYLTRINCDCST